MNPIRKLFFTAKGIGIKGLVNAVSYSSLRNRIDRRIDIQNDNQFSTPGKFIKANKVDCGGNFRFDNNILEVRFLNPDTLVITWDNSTRSVIFNTENNDPEVNFIEFEGCPEKGWHVANTNIRINISSQGNISFNNMDGKTIHEINPPQFYKHGFKQSMQFRREEHIYGLGEQSGPFNRRGIKFHLWNTDPGGSYTGNSSPIYINIPLYIGLHKDASYLILFENSNDSYFDFTEHPEVKFLAGCLRYYFIFGSPETILRHYLELTGFPPLPPRWALGYHQSRWGYKSQEEVRNILLKFNELHLPISAIHLDIDYMDGYRVFSIDRSRFPRIKDMADEFNRDDIHFVTILDPGVKIDPHYSVYQSGIENNVFCKLPDGKNVKAPVWPGWCNFPDFLNKDAREWWADQYQSLIQAGISGFWHDMNEPSAFISHGEPTLPRSTLHSKNGKTIEHIEGHNLYGLNMNRAGYEGLLRLRPDARPWIVSRSGWAGNQRYTWNWTGDVEGSWEMLHRTISLLIGMSLSGFYYAGSDIGSFSTHPSPELYLRWFQMASCTPFFRTHSALAVPEREPWRFGDLVLNACRKALHLRYSLMPYFYTLAWQATMRGLPLIRPLFWDEPTNASLWDIDDSFLLGDTLIAAPIIKEAVNERDIILPKGPWFTFWDNKQFQGSQSIQIQPEIDDVPLLVRGGKILPRLDGDILQLHIYSPGQEETGNNIESELYSDDGDGFTPGRLDIFHLRYKNDKVSIEWDKSGDFHWPYPNYCIRLHGLFPSHIIIDGCDEPDYFKKIYSKPFNKLEFTF